jgi:hypothetical protein
VLDKARNDLSAAVPKFCLALEEHRRTPDGRVRTSQELLTSFFPHDEKVSTDKLFKYLPNEVRGPIIAAWGIRGIKAALRDDDDRIQQVVYDALVAGDVDHSAFEEGLTPETLVRWVPLGDLWSFWRGGKLTKQAIHKALSTAYELYLFDARWFLDALHSKGGALKGTNVLSDGLTKDELTQWVHRIHETGDGTPKGLVAALGWDKIVTKTPNDVLVGVLDAMVVKVGLVQAPTGAGREPPRESSPKLPDTSAKGDAKPEPPGAAAASIAPATPAVSAAPPAPDPAKSLAPNAAPPGEVKLEPLRQTDKPPGPDDTSWSAPPPPDPGLNLSLDDSINVVVEEEVLIADRNAPPTAPRIRSASPAEEEDTEVKQVPRGKSARPGPPPRR